METAKNQTFKEHIPEDIDVLGIAFFVSEDNTSERGFKKELIEDISYRDALLESEKYLHFRYLPYGTAIKHFEEEIFVKKGIFNKDGTLN